MKRRRWAEVLNQQGRHTMLDIKVELNGLLWSSFVFGVVSVVGLWFAYEGWPYMGIMCLCLMIILKVVIFSCYNGTIHKIPKKCEKCGHILIIESEKK